MKLRRVFVEGAAKINIGLRVGPRRDDGFHDVEGLVQTISVIDRLEVIAEDDADAPLVRVVAIGNPDLETDDNLIVRAGTAIAERADASPVRVVLRKSIPVAAGLGGGSADAASALVAFNQLWGAGLSARELIALGASVGSDVPALLVGGLVHISGRGERVRNVKSLTAGWVVLGVSNDGISAADAYAAFDRIGPGSDLSALHHNDLEQAALDLRPELRGRLLAMRDAAGLAFVSGSGPTVVAPVATEAAAVAVREQLRDVFDDVLIARPTDWGVRLTLGRLGDG